MSKMERGQRVYVYYKSLSQDTVVATILHCIQVSTGWYKIPSDICHIPQTQLGPGSVPSLQGLVREREKERTNDRFPPYPILPTVQ